MADVTPAKSIDSTKTADAGANPSGAGSGADSHRGGSDHHDDAKSGTEPPKLDFLSVVSPAGSKDASTGRQGDAAKPEQTAKVEGGAPKADTGKEAGKPADAVKDSSDRPLSKEEQARVSYLQSVLLKTASLYLPSRKPGAPGCWGKH